MQSTLTFQRKSQEGGRHGRDEVSAATDANGNAEAKSRRRRKHETRKQRNARINAQQREKRLADNAKLRSQSRILQRMRRRGVPMPAPGDPIPTEEEVPPTPRKLFDDVPSDALERALAMEGVEGNRVAQVVGTQFVTDDFKAMAQDFNHCQVCFGGEPGMLTPQLYR